MISCPGDHESSLYQGVMEFPSLKSSVGQRMLKV